jgi:hypothetical protein
MNFDENGGRLTEAVAPSSALRTVGLAVLRDVVLRGELK